MIYTDKCVFANMKVQRSVLEDTCTVLCDNVSAGDSSMELGYPELVHKLVGHQVFWCGREGYIYGKGTSMEMNSQYLTVCFLYSWQVNRIATGRWKWHIWALRNLLFKVPNKKVSIAKLSMQKFKHFLLKAFHYCLKRM